MKIIKTILTIIGCICLIPVASVIWIPVVAGIILAKMLDFEKMQDLFISVGVIAITFVAEIIWMKYVMIPLVTLIGL